MAPKVKFRKEEIVNAALSVSRRAGADAVTAREVAAELGVSTRPIFTYFETIEQLKGEVFQLAKGRYRAQIERGLADPVPFLGVWHQYIRFARDEPEFYKLLYLTKTGTVSGGASEAMPSRISSLASRMPSREPRFSMCMVPMLVMRTVLGRAMAVSLVISPK